MARGILGKVEAGTGDTAVYTVPADNFAVVTINACNTTTQTRSVRIAIAGDSGNVQLDEYIEYDVDLIGAGTLERTGIVIDAGKTVTVRSNSTGVAVMVYGIETSTV
jgi:hypothetical protein